MSQPLGQLTVKEHTKSLVVFFMKFLFSQSQYDVEDIPMPDTETPGEVVQCFHVGTLEGLATVMADKFPLD